MNIAAFDLNLLLVFEALMSERNVTRAASRVGLSQPAMSNALGRLRKSLGDPLFIRSGSKMAPTAKARRLADSVTAALIHIRSAIGEHPQFDPGRATMQIRIATTDYGEFTALRALLPVLRRQAPSMSIAVQRNPKLFEAPKADLESGSADYAIGFYPESVSPGLRLFSLPLFAEEWVCVARRSAYNKLTLKRYAEAQHIKILYGVDDGGPGAADQALKRAGLSRSVALVLPHLMTIPFIVADTDLLGAVPLRLALALQPFLSFDIHRLPIDIPEHRMMLVWHERVHADPAHQWFRQSLQAACVKLSEAPTQTRIAGRKKGKAGKASD